MKSLYIVRHGKSSWQQPLADRRRPLSRRGVHAAQVMGRLLDRADRAPDLILTSPAVRASDTARLMAEAAMWSTSTVSHDDLYHADASEVIEVIRQTERSVETLMVVGHEPWCSELVEVLTGADVRFVTAAFAWVVLPISTWSQARSGELKLFLPPKFFTSGDFPWLDEGL